MTTVRRVQSDDASALVPLFATLGYPTTTDRLRKRIARLLADATYDAWIAVDTDMNVVGFAAGHLIYPIENDTPAAQLIALVSAEHARGQGVGSSLCTAFEQWATIGGATRAVLSSGQNRPDAHRFYEYRGYIRSGIKFGKQLAEMPQIAEH